MIWNQDILFLHAPKTGGMSITAYFSDHLSNYRITEKRHETLAEARSELASLGIALEAFQQIFVVLRNPYTLEISRFNYLRLGRPWDKGPDQELALSGDFKRYLREAPFFGHFPPRLDLYYHEDGRAPANLRVLRYERLEDEIRQHVAPFLRTANAPLPHENPTIAARFEEYYDSEAEEFCYLRHRWFFDTGLYSRRYNGERICLCAGKAREGRPSAPCHSKS